MVKKDEETKGDPVKINPNDDKPNPDIDSDEKLNEKIRKEDEEFIKNYEDVKIEELFSYGFVRHEVTLHGSIKAVIRTLMTKEDKDLAKRLGNYSGTNLYVGAENGDDILEYCLLSFGQNEFSDPSQARLFMENQSMAVKVLLIQEFKRLNKAVAILLRGPGGENPLVTPLAGTGVV